MAKEITLSPSLHGNPACYEIGRSVYDCTSEYDNARTTISRLDGVDQDLCLRHLKALYTHRIYYAEEASILVWHWKGADELLSIPLVGDQLVIHYQQNAWTHLYPFLLLENDRHYLLDGLFARQNWHVPEPYIFLGRDHWGHFVSDFLGRYFMSLDAGLKFRHHVLLGEAIRTNHSSISALMRGVPSAQHYFPYRFDRPTIIALKGCYISDWGSYAPFLLQKTEANLITSIASRSRIPRIALLHANASWARISGYRDLVQRLSEYGVQLIDPLSVRDAQSASRIYGRFNAVISPHGSCLLNPLILTDLPIILLWPSLTVSKVAHPCDIGQYSEYFMMFGSRVTPVFGEPAGSLASFGGHVNESINWPHSYCASQIASACFRCTQ